MITEVEINSCFHEDDGAVVGKNVAGSVVIHLVFVFHLLTGVFCFFGVFFFPPNLKYVPCINKLSSSFHLLRI